MPTGFNSVSTLNLDSLSASCLERFDSSNKLSESSPSEAKLFEVNVDLDVDRLERGVPWLCRLWFGTWDALIILHRHFRVALVQYIPGRVRNLGELQNNFQDDLER